MTFYSSGVAGKSKWKTIKATLDPSDTKDVEVTLFSLLRRSVYEIEFSNDTEGKYRSLTLHVQRTDTDVEHSAMSRLGQGLDVAVNVIKSGSDVIIRMTNNELFAVSVCIETLKLRR